MPAPPYRAIAERRLTDRLMLANAVWPGSGHTLENLPGLEQRALKRLLASGVIRQEGADHYYLYAPAYAAHRATRRRRIVIALLIVVFLGVIASSGAVVGLANLFTR